MARFLIEVAHEADVAACARVVDTFLRTGSHFLTNAEWGCRDGDHRAWLIVDVDDKAAARAVLPPGFRQQAKVVELHRFSLDEIGAIFRAHGLE
jgi:hypothetical protein